MSSSMSISEVRAALPEVVRRVTAGEEITITRHRQAVAVILRPDALRARRIDTVLAGAQEVRHALEQGRSSPLQPARISPQRAEELVDDVRAGRGER